MPSKNTNLIALIVAALLAGGALAAERHENHRHHAFAKDVDALHAVLAPLWHARPGKERSQNVCAKTSELERLAGDIRSADPKSMLQAIGALKKQCQTSPTDIDAAFFDVHEAFHRLAEPGGH
ncbi:MAG: hypothetical protein HYU74_07600 [Dechloromonas sp.]|nr:hypothetical protein [Dechloromonas sp.]